MSAYKLTLSAAILAMAAGCASTGSQTMNTDSRVPAAQGEVKAREGDNGNTQLSVHVKHMAKPEAVEPMANTYVVWARDSSGSGNAQNLGALQVDDDLEGELDAVTPLKHFDIFVTAEPVATAQYPTGSKTLWTSVEAE